MPTIGALGLLLLYGGVSTVPLSIEGSYVAATMNGRSLPTDLRIPATEGDFRLLRLEQGVLRLSQDGRFILHFRYYHQLVRSGAKPTARPVMSESETGTYSLSANKLVLTPMKKKGAQARPVIAATITGGEIRASYVLSGGSARERVTLILRRDASYW